MRRIFADWATFEAYRQIFYVGFSPEFLAKIWATFWQNDEKLLFSKFSICIINVRKVHIFQIEKL